MEDMMTTNLYAKLYQEQKDSEYGWLDTSDVAKIIRLKLAENFPLKLFSVRTHKYSGGSSIDVDWIDGPTKSEVEKVIGYLTGQGFDSSIDLAYGHKHFLTPTDIFYAGTYGTADSHGSVAQENLPTPDPTAILVNFGNYLFCNRHNSDDFLEKAISNYNAKFGNNISLQDYKLGAFDYSENYWIRQEIDIVSA
jgi:hypothetical protein